MISTIDNTLVDKEIERRNGATYLRPESGLSCLRNARSFLTGVQSEWVAEAFVARRVSVNLRTVTDRKTFLPCQASHRRRICRKSSVTAQPHLKNSIFPDFGEFVDDK